MTQLLPKLLLPTLIMGWSTFYFIEMAGKNESASYLINPIYYIMIILFVINLYTDIKGWKKTRVAEQEDMDTDKSMTKAENTRVAIFIVGIFVYLIATLYLGFILSTILFLFASFYYLGARKKLAALAVAVGLSMILFLLFKVVLDVPLIEFLHGIRS